MKHLKRSVLQLLLASLFGALAAAPALAAPSAQPSAPGFKVYDKDGDGAVSQAEFLVQGGQEAAFRAADVNRDNRLDRDEFLKASASNERLKAGKTVDDAVITARVKMLLLRDAGVNGSDLQVLTHKGMVLLSGSVDDASQIALAERLTRGVEGVKLVSNDLRVKR